MVLNLTNCVAISPIVVLALRGLLSRSVTRVQCGLVKINPHNSSLTPNKASIFCLLILVK